MQYKFEEIYSVEKQKFRLHYHEKEQYREIVKCVDHLVATRKPGQNYEVYFLPGGPEIRITYTSTNCASVYFKRREDLE